MPSISGMSGEIMSLWGEPECDARVLQVLRLDQIKEWCLTIELDLKYIVHMDVKTHKIHRDPKHYISFAFSSVHLSILAEAGQE